MIIPEYKLIFIHIPKCGGTSIEVYISNNYKLKYKFCNVLNNIEKNSYILDKKSGSKALQHLTALEIRQNFNDFEKYYKFSVVRNPYDRIISEYHWSRTIKSYKSYNKFDDFLKHVQNVFKNKDFYKNLFSDHLIPQYLFLYENNKLIVDKVYKFEEFYEIEKNLKDKYNIDRKMRVCNKTKKEKIKLNKIQKEVIYNLYKKDFELFKYDK